VVILGHLLGRGQHGIIWLSTLSQSASALTLLDQRMTQDGSI
jgi:hypothetical protein